MQIASLFSPYKLELLSLGLMTTPILSGKFRIKGSERNRLLLLQMPKILEGFQMCTLQIYYPEKKIFILVHKLSSSMKIKQFSKNHFMTSSCYCCCRLKVYLFRLETAGFFCLKKIPKKLFSSQALSGSKVPHSSVINEFVSGD